MDPVLSLQPSHVVQEHCEAVNASSILQCLADFSADFNFDPKCQAILRKRIAQRMRDFRLNPSLQRACRHGSLSQIINMGFYQKNFLNLMSCSF
jgi:hypothetical protein